MSAKNRITTNLDAKKYEELTALSEKLDVSLAWLGRRAFADLLAKYNRASETEQDMLMVVTSSQKSLSRS